MKVLPTFAEAVRDLQRFLTSEGAPSQVSWAFREDVYSVAADRHRVVWPLPAENESIARQQFEAGRKRGLAELLALFRVDERSIVTVVAPEQDEIQGWSQGLKLSVRQPFTRAMPISPGTPWLCHRLRRQYKRFQRHGWYVPRKGRQIERQN